MPGATLVIDADMTAVERAFAGMSALAQRTQAAMTAEARKGEAERTRSTQRERNATTSAAREVERERRRAERAATRDATRGARERIAAGKNETTLAVQQSRERIAAANRESRERTAIARATIARATALEVEATRAHASEEARRTAATQREEARRTAAMRASRREQQSRGAGFARAIGAVGVRGVMTEHDAMQDARRTRATSGATLAGAVALAGGDVSEVRTRTAAMNAFAQEHGFDAADVAEAARAGQAEFNVLGSRDQTPAQRAESFQQFLRDYREGADTFADPSQHVRLSGMLRQQGFSPELRRRALSVVGAATQAGSVEEGDLLRGGMQSFLRRMNAATPRAGETADAARMRELTAAVTEMEVARQVGVGPQRAGNILASTGSTLRGNVAQRNILTNIENAGTTASLTRKQRARLASTLYEGEGANRRLRTQYQSATGLAEGFRAAGLTGQQFANVTAGGGVAGNRQSLAKNARDLLSSLMTGGGLENIRAMQAAGGITRADTDRMQSVRESLDSTRLVSDEQRLLTERTTGLAAGVSNAVGDFQRLHPVTSNLVTEFTKLGTSVGGWMGMRAMLGYSATTVAAGGGAGAAVGAGGLAGAARGLGLLGGSAVGASLLAGHALQGGDVSAQGLTMGQRMGRGALNAASSIFSPEAAIRAVVTGVERGLAMAHITATIAPHDAAHAASTVATPTAGGAR